MTIPSSTESANESAAFAPLPTSRRELLTLLQELDDFVAAFDVVLGSNQYAAEMVSAALNGQVTLANFRLDQFDLVIQGARERLRDGLPCISRVFPFVVCSQLAEEHAIHSDERQQFEQATGGQPSEESFRAWLRLREALTQIETRMLGIFLALRERIRRALDDYMDASTRALQALPDDATTIRFIRFIERNMHQGRSLNDLARDFVSDNPGFSPDSLLRARRYFQQRRESRV